MALARFIGPSPHQNKNRQKLPWSGDGDRGSSSLGFYASALARLAWSPKSAERKVGRTKPTKRRCLGRRPNPTTGRLRAKSRRACIRLEEFALRRRAVIAHARRRHPRITALAGESRPTDGQAQNTMQCKTAVGSPCNTGGPNMSRFLGMDVVGSPRPTDTPQTYL